MCKAAADHGECLDSGLKQAQSFTKDLLYSAVALSVLAGVPLGLAAHAVSRGGSHVGKKENQRLGSLDQYLAAAHRLNPTGVANV